MAVLTTGFQLLSDKWIARTNAGNLYIRIYGKYNSYNSGAGTVNVTTELRVYLSVGSMYSNGCSWSIDGQYGGGNLSMSAGERTLISSTYDVPTNDNGTSRGYTSNGGYDIYGASGSTSAGFDTPTIPRYASITGYNASAVNETTIRVNWSANVAIDWVQYSLNGGGWANASGSTFDIGNLNAGTQYSLRIRVRRSDSGLWTESGTLYPTTYSYPYVSNVGTSNLVIGNSQTLTLYNPLGRSVTVKMYQNSTSGLELHSETTSGKSVTFTPDSEILYNSIPNTTNGVCVYSVIYGSSTKTTGQNSYIINVNDSKPIFEDFDYSTNMRELTGNSDTIINGRTTITFTIPSSKKAIGKNSATINRYVFTCGNSDPVLANYSNETVTAQVSNCSSDIMRVTAIDSRGLETTISKTVRNFKNYFLPTFVEEKVEREDGIEETVFLDMKLQFWNYNFGLKRNNILSINYRIKESSSEEYSNWYPVNLSSLVIDRENATLDNVRIYSDGISGGFVVGNFYDFQLQVIDGNGDYELSTVVSSVFNLMDGKVAFSILKDGDGEYHIGINGMPDLNSTMKIYGNIVSDNS